ncbi:MAG: hypothetical protein U0232_03650 [Thermomicrobiales bacterium]
MADDANRGTPRYFDVLKNTSKSSAKRWSRAWTPCENVAHFAGAMVQDAAKADHRLAMISKAIRSLAEKIAGELEGFQGAEHIEVQLSLGFEGGFDVPTIADADV